MIKSLVRFRPLHLLVLPAALLLTVSACTEDKLVALPGDTVLVPRPPFNPPADSVNGFLGLFDVSTNQTACGNCHAGLQRAWNETAHADAYDGLVSSGGAQAFCYGCHTVSELGNPAGLTGNPAGWNFVTDSAARTTYRNVQCESCHGAGFTHSQNPTRANAPLARATIADTAASCAACHSGGHHPFAEQWAQSAHAVFRPGANEPGNRSGCIDCHNGIQVISRLSGFTPNVFVEAGNPATPGVGFATTCVVCHDPHGSTNSAQLRLPINSTDQVTNLCSNCHTRSATPAVTFTSTSRGAHASQGAVYFGQAAGWQPPGFSFNPDNPIQTSHFGTDRLCATCHVVRFETTDATGAVFNSVGHLFSPNPCVDANGVPTDDKSCAYNATARNWGGCVASGCHATANAAAGLFNSSRSTVNVLAQTLWNDLDGDKVLEVSDQGLLPRVLQQRPTTTNRATDSTHFCCTSGVSDSSLSVAEGALFNARMLAENLYSHNDGSFGVHNPALYNGLLSASISAVRNRYGLTVQLDPQVEALMQKSLAAPGVKYIQERQTASR